MNIKALIKKAMYRHRSSSQSYMAHLRKLGMRIGEGTTFYDPLTTIVDETRPWMISIGQNCNITAGVTILTHDYGWSVIKGYYGDIIGSSGRVVIGNNVFIGTQTTILAGVKIGDNVIIGANSLVNKSIPDNCVAVGNPCCVVKTLDEYYQKRKQVELDEAVDMVLAYEEVYGHMPPVDVMREHFWLFENDIPNLNKEFLRVMNLVSGSQELSSKRFLEHSKQFENYTDFLAFCIERKEKMINEKV